MSDITDLLDLAAIEIAADGFKGWGNTCQSGADRIRELEVELEMVKAEGIVARAEAKLLFDEVNSLIRILMSIKLLKELDEKDDRIRELDAALTIAEGYMSKSAAKRFRAQQALKAALAEPKNAAPRQDEKGGEK